MARTHRTAELRSIALHEIVARRSREDPAVLDAARSRVAGWIAEGGPVDERYARRWQDLLGRADDAILAALVADTEEMRDLRQCSPFSDAVTPDEWLHIVATVGEEHLAAP
jgi:hypothetical protein